MIESQGSAVLWTTIDRRHIDSGINNWRNRERGLIFRCLEQGFWELVNKIHYSNVSGGSGDI